MKLKELSRHPLVSVLVPNYNYGRYLADAIDSVRAQDYTNMQLVVCDDGSTDNSLEVLEKLQARTPDLVIISKINSGQASALNTAYEASRGEIICLLDSDDFFFPNKISRVVEEFRAKPTSGFAVNRMRKISASGVSLGEVPVMNRLPNGWQGERISLRGPQVLRGLPPCSGLSFRREVAEAMFPLPNGLRAYADTMVQILAPMLTPIIAIEDALSAYRVHGGNVAGSGTFSTQQLEDRARYETELWLRWRVQIETLSSHGPSAGFRFEETPVSLWTYAQARYERKPEIRRLHRDATSSLWFQAMSRGHRYYWKTSVLLPQALFRKSLAFVYGQSPAKLLVSRFSAAVRNWVRGASIDRSAQRRRVD
jgi:hypothetical protein